ncbi:MAG: AraC family transcriptional regulator [Flavobacteriales bacterium CG_4_9_14_3_um_filter_40_17]|nr:MAG: AraC family transcriptional regulator [Flavobacteriales bacterium CG_4_9_14_3_um_filter_40_17]
MTLSNLKPSLEKISPPFGSSIMFKQYAEQSQNKDPQWHFHPEVELVCVNGGMGKRLVGSHVSFYRNGDLILIGSNLPHYGFTDRLTGNESETIIQFREDFLGEGFLTVPEMSGIRKLLERAKMGVVFHGETKKSVGARIEKLGQYSYFERLIRLLQIFKELDESDEYTILNAQGFVLEVEPQDNQRIDMVFGFVRENFSRSITLEEISSLVSMTIPAFCRYFKKITGKTFTQFVNEYRLVHASKLLAEKPSSITEICYESGFNNFSHFNKLFKGFTGRNPSTYRNELKLILK